eukprot:TRINITY_DN30987_c0_g2_i1.p1 TRINITY_DN30987_c0_g2~~TRINITY_DN30987_c0_g2_i1.p1  ORF type:complete len:178 (+),score=44.70 TRINITY_DN30987_c0_g2_i1:88-621(+)
MSHQAFDSLESLLAWQSRVRKEDMSQAAALVTRYGRQARTLRACGEDLYDNERVPPQHPHRSPFGVPAPQLPPKTAEMPPRSASAASLAELERPRSTAYAEDVTMLPSPSRGSALQSSYRSRSGSSLAGSVRLQNEVQQAVQQEMQKLLAALKEAPPGATLPRRQRLEGMLLQARGL